MSEQRKVICINETDFFFSTSSYISFTLVIACTTIPTNLLSGIVEIKGSPHWNEIYFSYPGFFLEYTVTYK